METLKKERAKIKAALTRFSTYLNNANVDTRTDILILKLEETKKLLNKFDTIQSEIEYITADDDTLKHEQENERFIFEETYYQLICKAQEIIGHPISERPVAPSNSNNAEYKIEQTGRMPLPKISLPTFDGSYSNWIKFRDTFKSLVHENARLNNIQKYHYLNSSLKGAAARTIEALGVSEANYEVAWQRLQSRYEDENTLINYHIGGIFDSPRITKDSHVDLLQLIDTIKNHLLALKSLGENTEHWDKLMIYIVASKLNTPLKNEWEKFRSKLSTRTTFDEMMKFLENHCRYLHNIHSDKVSSIANKIERIQLNSNKQAKSYAVITSKSCPLCKESHALYQCEKFKKLSPTNRVTKVQELKLCFNCLSNGHYNAECKFGPCRKCKGKHNSLLHIDRQIGQDNTSTEAKQINPVEMKQLYSIQVPQTNIPYTLLGTANVYIHDKYDKLVECRALLDSCSQAHIMTTELCNRLALQKKRASITLTGIEHGSRNVAYQITTKLSSKTINFSTTLTCLILDKIGDDFPSKCLKSCNITVPSGLELADPEYYNPRSVDLLIGASLFYELLCVGQIKLNKHSPILQKTMLGWIVAGNINFAPENQSRVVCNLIKNDDLNHQLTKFWEIEHCFKQLKPTLKDDICEQHFINSTKRSKNNHFIVSIPFTHRVVDLGESRTAALKRFHYIEKKLERNQDFKESYVAFMDEYERLGHMSEITEHATIDNIPHYYLPHHAVIKEESTTTKMRVVFDGSAKTTSGLSLNDVQHIGPPCQNDLFSILLRFRQHRYVLSADVTKMYRQIEVQEQQRPMQRILWRKNKDLPIKIYELKTVTYGTASAPFLATRCLKQIGIECEAQYPVSSKIIINDFYVDDLLTGTDSIEAAIQLRKDLSKILGASGLELRKWTANDSRILNNKNTANNTLVNFFGDKNSKTLGLFWNSEDDTLKYRVNKIENYKVTKRCVLSIIAQIFDPLGLLGPAITQAKALMQEIWKLNLNWDEALPQNLHTSWLKIYNGLITINDTIINRYAASVNSDDTEFHGFCDASEVAYGACIYICSKNENKRTTQLLCAKSRIAPLKSVSIPRLELLGAVLLAQLAQKVTTACKVRSDQWTFWTDSMIVLQWIKSPSYRWKTFIANRTTEINETTNGNWRHVNSENNPADLISRGMTAKELQAANLWWRGPEFLLLATDHWPISKDINTTDIPEEKPNYTILMANTPQEGFNDKPTKQYNYIFDRFSSYTRMIRTIAYCFRYINNCKAAIRLRNHTLLNSKIVSTRALIEKIPPLSANEIEIALDCLLLLAQRDTYTSEFHNLKNDRNISKTSSLQQLNPFLDKQGLLRVGGRLRNANINYNQKYPIVLPPRHRITDLIIKFEHHRLHHAGCQAVLNSLRQRYWLTSGRSRVREILRQCISCFKVRPTELPYFMAEIPSERVTPTRPFFKCGVDYAGPFFIKERTRSRTSIKTYICIFICFATKAVHIELAHDLSTDAFLNCMRRFISRRGRCKDIFSDNGTNFVGAKNHLSELQALLKSTHFRNDITNFLSTEKINWHMIPPNAPHFGGLWEAAVKSAKYHLKRVIGETRLTYEELLTILTQVEACLNSRPLSPLSNDPNDITPLTPGHFLIGDLLTAFPQCDVRETNINRLNRYELLQNMIQHFWKRWHQEYLPELQARTKWNKPLRADIIKPGTMVLVRENNTAPMQWPLGRIVEIYPGQDKIVRVVSIRVAQGRIIKRPVSSIRLLPFPENETSTPPGVEDIPKHHY